MIGVILRREKKEYLDKVIGTKFYVNDNIFTNTLIIDATYTEPYYHVNEYLIEKYPKEIIKEIKNLLDQNKIKECIIAITQSNPNLEEKLITLSDKYKNIKVLKTPNIYPISLDKNLIRLSKHTDKVNDVKVIELKDFYRLEKDKIITVYFDKIYDIKVAYKSKIKDILKDLNIKGDFNIFENGPLKGRIVDENAYINDLTNALYIEDKNNIKEEKCIRCGKCMNNCPLKLNPTILNKELKEKCIKCGICTYICPSFIPLKQKIEEFNND